MDVPGAVPRFASEDIDRVPPLMVVPPVNVLLPDSVRVPASVLRRRLPMLAKPVSVYEFIFELIYSAAFPSTAISLLLFNDMLPPLIELNVFALAVTFLLKSQVAHEVFELVDSILPPASTISPK